MTRARMALLAAALAPTCLSCGLLATIEYRYPDPMPLVSAKLDLDHGIVERFGDYKIRRRRGDDGRYYAREPQEFVSTELYKVSTDGRVSWQTTVQMSLYGSDDEAASEFRSLCKFVDRDFLVHFRIDDGEASGYCLSPISQQTSDPEGWYIPIDSYDQIGVIRRDRLVVYLSESRNRSPGWGQMDEIIADIAGRLSASPPGDSLRPME